MKYSYNELLKDKKAVLFDLDGTLVDSMWVWRNIDIDFLSAIGQKLPADLQKCIEGMSFTETAEYFKKRFSIDDDVEDIKKKWNQMAYDKYTSEVRLKKGAKEFLERLKSDNIRIGIASSNSVTLIEGALKAEGVLEYFDAITTGCEAGAGKPAPDIYLLAAKKVGIAPSECLVFEDIPMGIMAGNSAGMTTVAVEDDYSHGMRKEKERLAKYFIEDYTEIV
ncbi:putative uncharacterized protein [Firmicutes bacterium CAG:882]|jgi:HAD superfamily hydrolase (TIGR01509 family)|nr:putative uncharacterized protein [Firmicutes bacterium CAG:882]